MTNVAAGLIELSLSAERLAPYRHACHGDLDQAIALYEWNVDISTAFWRTLGQVEVVLRNTLHERLAAWSTSTYRESRWYLDPANVLTLQARDDIAKARQRATRAGRDETPGRVVAELNFGFWRFLLARRYERTLRMPAIRAAFPRHHGIRRDVDNVLAQLHQLRNRIAHHEPIHAHDLPALRTHAVDLVDWISPDARQWIDHRCEIQAVLERRPTTTMA